MLIVNPLTAAAFFEIAKQGKHRAIISNETLIMRTATIELRPPVSGAEIPAAVSV